VNRTTYVTALHDGRPATLSEAHQNLSVAWRCVPNDCARKTLKTRAGLISFRFDGPSANANEVDRGQEIAGCSPSHTYNLIAQSKLKAVRVANKTAVVTQTLIQLIDAAEPWTPDRARIEAANCARLTPRTPSGKQTRRAASWRTIDLRRNTAALTRRR
jgi:hypothetical protein